MRPSSPEDNAGAVKNGDLGLVASALCQTENNISHLRDALDGQNPLLDRFFALAYCNDLLEIITEYLGPAKDLFLQLLLPLHIRADAGQVGSRLQPLVQDQRPSGRGAR